MGAADRYVRRRRSVGGRGGAAGCRIREDRRQRRIWGTRGSRGAADSFLTPIVLGSAPGDSARSLRASHQAAGGPVRARGARMEGWMPDIGITQIEAVKERM